MTQDQIASTVARFETTINAHDPAGAAALFTPGFVDHAPWPGHSPDAAGFAAGFAEMTAAFPDLHVEVQRTVVQGDILAWHFVMSGSQLGPFMGLEPSGRSFRIEAMDMLRLEDGLFAEHWGVMDAALMMEQLTAQ